MAKNHEEDTRVTKKNSWVAMMKHVKDEENRKIEISKCFLNPFSLRTHVNQLEDFHAFLYSWVTFQLLALSKTSHMFQFLPPK